MPMNPGESLEDYNRRMNAQARSAWYRANPDTGRLVMPHVNQMLSSKYLGKQDLPGPVIAHIRGVAMEPAGRNNEDPKWLMYFSEIRKPLKLNNTILKYLAELLGPNSDTWVGVKCQVYVDHSVQFGGQMVGGVRVRVAKSAQRPMGQVAQEFYAGATGAQPQGSGGPVFAGMNPAQPSAGAGAPPQPGPAPMQPQQAPQPGAGWPGHAAGPYPQGNAHQAPQPGAQMAWSGQGPPPADAPFDGVTGEFRPATDPDFDDDIPF